MPAAKINYEKLTAVPDDWKGRAVKDVASGWQGYALGVFDYVNGCKRIEIGGVKDDKPESFIFDEQQVLWGDKWMEGYEPAVAPAARRTGGPRGTTPPPR